MEQNVIKCNNCGSTISTNGKFCEYCGARLFLDEDAIKNIEDEVEAGAPVMTVTDILSIFGRTVVSGKLENNIKVGDTIKNTRTNQSFVVNGLELFRQVTEKAEKGNLCGLLIDADKKDVIKGDKLVF